MKKNTKIISNYLKRLKKDSKKKYFQEKLSFYKSDIKNTWKTLKDAIGKTKINENHLQKKIALENKEKLTKKLLPKNLSLMRRVLCKCRA